MRARRRCQEAMLVVQEAMLVVQEALVVLQIPARRALGPPTASRTHADIGPGDAVPGEGWCTRGHVPWPHPAIMHPGHIRPSCTLHAFNISGYNMPYSPSFHD